LFVDLVDGADVGMVESRSRLRFALEPGKSLGVFGDIVRKELDRCETAQLDLGNEPAISYVTRITAWRPGASR